MSRTKISLGSTNRRFGAPDEIPKLASKKKLLPPFYVALTGETVALPLFDSMLMLGREMMGFGVRDRTDFMTKKDRLTTNT